MGCKCGHPWDCHDGDMGCQHCNLCGADTRPCECEAGTDGLRDAVDRDECICGAG